MTLTFVKQMRAALEDLAEEGLIQVFKPAIGSQWIVGVVGVLQLDVLASRARAEYRAEISYEGLPYEMACWIKSDDPQALKTFIESKRSAIATDRDENPVFLAKSAWELDYTIKNNEGISFLKTKELE